MSTKFLDATPEKRIFLSIISEYDLKRSICELIDNAIDLWSKTKRADLEVRIAIDERQQVISIQDNAGGIQEDKLDHVISPGKTSNEINDDVIGYFGVGSKRAVVALAQDIAIYSRYEHEKAYVVKLDEEWITQTPSWQLPYAESIRDLSPYSTLIELSRLRIHLDSPAIAELKQHLKEVYAKYIERGAAIWVNEEKLVAIKFDDQWSYPPRYFPTRFKIDVEIEDRLVGVEILSGLIDHPGDPDNSYGVFFYCNNRLIARALTDFSVGFASGMIGNPHYNISLVRTIVLLRGQSGDMPWNSSKSGIDTKHEVFQAIQQRIIEATKRFSQVSRSLQGKWDSEVFPHKTGHVIEETLEGAGSIPKSYLPKPPASKPRWHKKVAALNKGMLDAKPWATGLLETIYSVDMIRKSEFSHKNRICLILLDSTLEIAYKEYLINEKAIGIAKFRGIATNRTEVQKEVASNLGLAKVTVQKIDYYYKLRCDLIHERATPAISEQQVDDYRKIVEDLLSRMFQLQFS